MAENENTITVVGRIGQEPELRTTTRGEVLNFTLATNERKRSADGAYSDGPTSWFRVAAWNDLALHAHASLHRGQQVIVRGVLTIREFPVEGGGKSRNAELRATALGHDLRWGTSAFTDGARPAVQPQALQQTVPPVVATEPAQQLETVPAAPPTNWGTTFADETPF